MLQPEIKYDTPQTHGAIAPPTQTGAPDPAVAYPPDPSLNYPPPVHGYPPHLPPVDENGIPPPIRNNGDIPKNTYKLYVAELSKQITNEDFAEMFSKYGNVVEATLMASRDKSVKSKGCGFVHFTTKQEAQAAIDALNDAIIYPGVGVKPLLVKFSEIPENKVFIGHIPRAMDSAEVQKIALRFGKIEEFLLLKDATGYSKGCAFVKYEERQSAEEIIRTLNNTKFPGFETQQQHLSVKYATNKRDRISDQDENNTPKGGGYNANFQGFQGNINFPVPGYQYGAPDYGYNQYQNYGNYGNPYPGYPPAYPGYPPAYTYPGYPPPAYPGSTPEATRIVTDDANIFACMLPQEWTDKELKDAFSPFGNVVSARVFIDRETGESKCYGFVSYNEASEAQAAIQNLNGQQVSGKRLKVSLKQGRAKVNPY